MSINNGNANHEIINYRVLPSTDGDWARLKQFMADVRGYIPPRQLGLAAVAETERGKIVGGLVLQMCPYLGPFKIDPEFRGHIDYIALKKIIDSCYKPKDSGIFGPLIIQGYVALTDDERISRMAENAGMERLHNAIVLVQKISDEKEGVPIMRQ